MAAGGVIRPDAGVPYGVESERDVGADEWLVHEHLTERGEYCDGGTLKSRRRVSEVDTNAAGQDVTYSHIRPVAITVFLNLAVKSDTAFTTADGFIDEDLRDVD